MPKVHFTNYSWDKIPKILGRETSPKISYLAYGSPSETTSSQVSYPFPEFDDLCARNYDLANKFVMSNNHTSIVFPITP